jgi:predicted small lipoprotein YifL
MQMSAGKSFAVIMALALTACGGFPTTHPDAAKNNPANYKVDIQDRAQSYPETPDGVYLKRRIECTKLKGWR